MATLPDGYYPYEANLIDIHAEDSSGNRTLAFFEPDGTKVYVRTATTINGTVYFRGSATYIAQE